MDNKPPEQGNETQPEQAVTDDEQAHQPQGEQPLEQAEEKVKEDPYWVNRIPAKTFHTICMVLGIIFALAGVIFLAFFDTMVGLVILGCGGIMLFAGISGLREERRQDDVK